jgi:hypothetical protein
MAEGRGVRFSATRRRRASPPLRVSAANLKLNPDLTAHGEGVTGLARVSVWRQ